jgi:ABC-type glycerol-3-phosphate transport system permease component
MSADISPLLVHTPAAARPLWLRLRRSSPFTLTVLMCCLALLWVSPFIWMLTTSFSAWRYWVMVRLWLWPQKMRVSDGKRSTNSSRRWPFSQAIGSICALPSGSGGWCIKIVAGLSPPSNSWASSQPMVSSVSQPFDVPA